MRLRITDFLWALSDNAHRKSVIRNLITALFTHRSIETTEKRAMAIEPLAHRLIEMAK
jgi:large subunit ribosomal protein L17